MLFGNEFHILGPWNRIENFLIFVLQVGKSQSIVLNIDESDFKFERFE